MRFNLAIGFAVAALAYSAFTASVDGQLFRRARCERSSCATQPYCPPKTSSCCGIVQTMVANPAPVVMNRGCGCGPTMNMGSPMGQLTPSVVDGGTDNGIQDQGCLDEYNQCMLRCKSRCPLDGDRKACEKYCACERAICNGTGTGPCIDPPCNTGGGGATTERENEMPPAAQRAIAVGSEISETRCHPRLRAVSSENYETSAIASCSSATIIDTPEPFSDTGEFEFFVPTPMTFPWQIRCPKINLPRLRSQTNGSRLSGNWGG